MGLRGGEGDEGGAVAPWLAAEPSYRLCSGRREDLGQLYGRRPAFAARRPGGLGPPLCRALAWLGVTALQAALLARLEEVAKVLGARFWAPGLRPHPGCTAPVQAPAAHITARLRTPAQPLLSSQRPRC